INVEQNLPGSRELCAHDTERWRGRARDVKVGLLDGIAGLNATDVEVGLEFSVITVIGSHRDDVAGSLRAVGALPPGVVGGSDVNKFGSARIAENKTHFGLVLGTGGRSVTPKPAGAIGIGGSNALGESGLGRRRAI